MICEGADFRMHTRRFSPILRKNRPNVSVERSKKQSLLYEDFRPSNKNLRQASLCDYIFKTGFLLSFDDVSSDVSISSDMLICLQRDGDISLLEKTDGRKSSYSRDCIVDFSFSVSHFQL